MVHETCFMVTEHVLWPLEHVLWQWGMCYGWHKLYGERAGFIAIDHFLWPCNMFDWSRNMLTTIAHVLRPLSLFFDRRTCHIRTCSKAIEHACTFATVNALQVVLLPKHIDVLWQQYLQCMYNGKHACTRATVLAIYVQWPTCMY